MPSLILSRQVDVACSVAQVYDLWGNLGNMPRLIPLIKSVKQLPKDAKLWRWRFGLRLLLIVVWVARIERRLPLQLIAWKAVSG